MERRDFNTMALGALSGALGIMGFNSQPAWAYDDSLRSDNGTSRCRIPTIPSFNGYIVALANGTVPAGEEAILGEPAIDLYYRDVRGFSDQEIAQQRQDASDFLMQRFGVDVDSPDYSFNAFATNPLANYRAYLISGKATRRRGRVMADGGWICFVTNPDGVTLGGEFAGMEVPAGAILPWGSYFIKGRKPIIINFQIAKPIIPGEFGVTCSECELQTSLFGAGVGLITTMATPMPNNQAQQSFRNIMTFSDNGGF